MTDLVVIESGEQSPDFASLNDAELDQGIRDETNGLIASWRHALERGWRLGQYLAEKKRRIGHGHWLDYVETELPFQHAQASSLMALGKANFQWLGSLEPGTTVTAAVELWQASRRQPRPIPARLARPKDPDPLLRFNVDRPTAWVVTKILATCFPDARDAMDATYGSGNFWDGSAHVDVVAAHDRDRGRAPSGVQDVTDLKYGERSFDVVAFDPPHLGEAAEGGVMGAHFGTADTETIKRTIMLGTRECWRVCELGILVKVTDHVHGELYLLESDWVMEALDWQTPYEVVYQVRGHAMIDPKWGTPQLSAYNNGAAFLVFRRGDQRHVERTSAQADPGR